MGALVAFGAYQVVATAMYTYELAEFHGVDWSLKNHGIAMNGHSSFGGLTDIADLEAVAPKSGGGPVSEWCQGITSMRGYVSMSFVGDLSVCCWAANDTQRMVPFKEEDGKRHYMCGKWPHIDHVYTTSESS